ncbi:MAG: hypothetical protein K5888_05960 [Lachnospiraceae bacterium]|nr:hypothetical protein [Lachnospiraceae bacterium]
MKKYIKYILITVILELLVFNFSSLRSAFNDPVDLSPYFRTEGVALYVEGIDLKIKNLYVGIDPVEHLPITFQLNATDEGNFYEYPMGIHTIALNTRSTRYFNLHGYGNIHSLVFYFSEDNQPDFSKINVIANPKRPLFINIWRMLIVLGIMCFFELLRTDGKLFNAPFEKEKNALFKKQTVILCAVALIWIVIGYKCTSSHLLFNEESKPHHQQYKELAVSLSGGSVALPFTPSDELLSAPNPYDTIYLQANGIEYRADYALYNGKYYVYFGIVPEILLYLPYYLVTGDGFPNHAAVFVFYALFVAGTFLLFRRMCETYFKNVSFAAYLLISSAAVTAGSFAYLYFTADLYSVPIMAAIGLTVMGLFLWMNGIALEGDHPEDTDNRKKRSVKIMTGLSYFAGSVCMSLVAGCRPQMLLFSFLAIPFFLDTVIKKRLLFSKKGIANTILLCVPYVCSAALVMWYNAARFGSVFDFGATYSLTSNDMNLRGLGISRMLSGLAAFLFKPPYITGRFPFLHTTTFDLDYMGRLITEHFYGGMIVCNALMWVLFLSYFLRNELKKRNVTLIFLILLFSGAVIGMLDANQAGVLQRYASETSFGFVFAAMLMLFVMMDAAFAKKTSGFALASGFLKIGFILSLIYTFMIICNTDSGITLIKYNPELFYKIASMFGF